MGKYSYWTGVNVWTTSNSQMPLGKIHFRTPALRLPTDTYVRSIWWAKVGFGSDASVPAPGWWAGSSVIFTATFVSNGSTAEQPALGGTEPPNRVAFADLQPTAYDSTTVFQTPSYQVMWKSPPDGIIGHQARRKGDGTNMPAVISQLNCRDQNSFFNGIAEPSYLLRCTITGRILWESDQAP